MSCCATIDEMVWVLGFLLFVALAFPQANSKSASVASSILSPSIAKSTPQVKLVFQRREIPPPGASDPRAVNPSWGSFVQRVDHFNPQDARTWQMRYLNNSQFFKPGGPLVVFLGGEWTIEAGFLMSGQVYEIAKKEGGYMFYPEHRFYGKSFPTKDLSTENLRYLTLEQALEDFAHFLAHQKSLPAFKNSSVIVTGGSYSATLATWMRLKYPHLVDIAYSSGAPLLAVVDFHEYLEAASVSLEAVNKTCTGVINQGIGAAEQLLKTPAGVATVAKAFKLCNASHLNEEPQRSHFFLVIASLIIPHVQYASGNSLAVLCDELIKSGKNPFEQLSNYVAKIAGDGCLGDYKDSVAYVKNASLTEQIVRQWTYHACTQLGFHVTTTSRKQIFGGGINLTYYFTYCADVFGKSFTPEVTRRGVDAVNLAYGGKAPKTSRLISTHGLVDPWHRLGLVRNLTQSVLAVAMPGVSHCRDLYATESGDPPQLIAARSQVLALVSKWLREVENADDV